MQYALIKNSIVENVIIAEPDFIAEFQHNYDHIEPLDTLHEQSLHVGIGWVYKDGEFNPPEVVVLPVQTKITQLAFLNRFTDVEAVAIDLASIGTTVKAASIRRYLQKVQASTFIDLSREDLRTGVQALESLGILTAPRVKEILDNPVLELEKFKE